MRKTVSGPGPTCLHLLRPKTERDVTGVDISLADNLTNVSFRQLRLARKPIWNVKLGQVKQVKITPPDGVATLTHVHQRTARKYDSYN